MISMVAEHGMALGEPCGCEDGAGPGMLNCPKNDADTCTANEQRACAVYLRIAPGLGQQLSRKL